MIEENFIPPSNMPEKRLDNVSKIIGTGPSTIKVIKNFIEQEDIDKFIDAIYWFLKDNYIQSNITIKKL